MKQIAEILSFLFHPVIFFLIMPFLVVYRYTQSHAAAIRWEIFSATFVLLAIAIVLIGRKKGIFSDCDLSKREERYEFYAFILFFSAIYIVSSLLLRGLIFPMTLIAIGITFGIVIFDFLNKYVKASNHVAVAAAFTTTVGLFYGFSPFLFVGWIVPVLIWARLVLHKHTKQEAIAGGILGVLITLLTFAAAKYMYR